MDPLTFPGSSIDLGLRSIDHWLTKRVKAHVLICLLACSLTWDLRKALCLCDEVPLGQNFWIQVDSAVLGYVAGLRDAA